MRYECPLLARCGIEEHRMCISLQLLFVLIEIEEVNDRNLRISHLLQIKSYDFTDPPDASHATTGGPLYLPCTANHHDPISTVSAPAMRDE